MNKIICIMLVGLLGFSGCGDNNDGTSPVGEAIPVAPYGLIHENPTYIWHSLQWATKYRIVVAGKYSTETPIMMEEYTAEEAGCESGDVLCMARPEATFSPSSDWQWMVRACANDECDYWSEPLEFKTSEDWGDPIPFAGGGRYTFTQNNDKTVTADWTGDIWLKSSDYAGKSVLYSECADACYNLTREEYPVHPPGYTYVYEWRVPTSAELNSLYDAVPKGKLGQRDVRGFFDGTPFTTRIIMTLGSGPRFWSSSQYPSHKRLVYRYVWDFNPYHEKNKVVIRACYEGGEKYACWCVGEKINLMVGP